MEENRDTILFTFIQWKEENDRVVKEAREAQLNYDPYPRTEYHVKYADEMFKQFPIEEPIHIQIAYLFKNMICAQRFDYGNKRTAHNMIVQFAYANGYEIIATDREWIRVSKKIQRKVPKAYVIHRMKIKIGSRIHRMMTGSGGGYAVDIANIPMKADRHGSSWYNPWLTNWVKKHIRKKANRQVL